MLKINAKWLFWIRIRIRIQGIIGQAGPCHSKTKVECVAGFGLYHPQLNYSFEFIETSFQNPGHEHHPTLVSFPVCKLQRLMDTILAAWQWSTLCGIISWIWLSSYLNITHKLRSCLQPSITRLVISGTPFILQIQVIPKFLFSYYLCFFHYTLGLLTEVPAQAIGWCFLSLVMCRFGALLHCFFTFALLGELYLHWFYCLRAFELRIKLYSGVICRVVMANWVGRWHFLWLSVIIWEILLRLLLISFSLLLTFFLS